MGLIANRSNSVFASSNKKSVLVYAEVPEKVFIVIPIGDFHFAWSPKISDLQQDIFDTWMDDNVWDKQFFTYPDNVKKEAQVIIRKEIRQEEAILRKLRKQFFNTPKSKQKDIKLEIQKSGIKLKNLQDQYDNFVPEDWLDYVPKKELNMKKFRSVLKSYRQDKNLIEAIKSGNEIMIASKEVLLIRVSFYEDIVARLLNGEEPRFKGED
jgi:hypothetical protein